MPHEPLGDVLDDKSVPELKDLADFFDERADQSVEAFRRGGGDQLDELAKVQRHKAMEVRLELDERT